MTNKIPKLIFTTVPEIISETDDYLVINKPAGLAVHGGGNLTEPTLADWLINYYPKIKKVGDDSVRPGIVHRLDKEVSGLMVIAKNQKSFTALKEQFKSREIVKEYLALVYGQVANDEGLIDFPIKRSQTGHKMAALPLKAEKLLTRRHPQGRDQGNINGWFKARSAQTEFQILKKFVNYTLLRVKIKTGRTHQIRVHFFAYGHPLVGDNLYVTPKTKIKNKKLNLGRIFLMAEHLSFRDLNGQEQDFKIELPSELAAALPRN
jgi:23S rRNA pseudouridine1911/1915/1917 synthase